MQAPSSPQPLCSGPRAPHRVLPRRAAKPRRSKKAQRKPNVVFVMTDDQAAEQMRFMPKTNALLAQGGVNFRNSFSTYPLCCPSRATWLTGQYAHNHDVRTNSPPSGGYGKIAPTLFNSLPAWLQKAGYRTAHIGKFLNGYGRTSLDTEIPPDGPSGTGRSTIRTHSLAARTRCTATR